MEEIMSNNQRILTRYLAAVGCNTGVVFKIVLNLWNENAVLEMLQFCKDNPKANSAQLLKASSEIASKYNLED